MPRHDFKLAEKISFLDQIKKQPPHTSQRRLVEITGLAKTTILRLIKQENELREAWRECEGQGRQGTSQKRKREGKDPDVEEALNE